MKKIECLEARRFARIIIATVCLSPLAHADVTIQQKTNLDVASVIRLHGASTTSVTADKKREDTESHCEGIMSIVCGNLQGGDIVRLDRDLSWQLEPKKKLYREQVFASPAELAEMRAKMQANLEKMRSCPVSQKQQPIDKSQCQMSEPKIEVHRTNDKMAIAGHDAERTLATLTETCTNKDTGDVCDTVIAVEVWLTDDKLPGSDDRSAFNRTYAKKLGIADSEGLVRSDVVKYLAPYQNQIRALQAKSDSFKGQPLKTSLRVLVGGPQCRATAKSKSDGADGTTSSSAANPLNDMAQAGRAMGGLVGGLFHRKKPDDSTPAVDAAAPGDSPATAVPSAPDPFPQMVQMGSFTQETVAINTDPIPADRFEIPAGWTREVPKSTKVGDDDFTCPKSGS